MKLNVIMNGPSLLDSVEYIDNKIPSLVCNHFADHKLFMEINPRYYMFIDPYFWRSDVRPEFKDMRERTFHTLASSAPRKYIVPNKLAFNMIKKYGGSLADSEYEILKLRYSVLGRNIYDYIPYNNRIIRELNKLRILTISPSNVSFCALYWCIYSKYTQLHLHGFDFTIFKNLYVDKENKLNLQFEHFYKTNIEPVYKNKIGHELSTTKDELLKWYKYFVYIDELSYHLKHNEKIAINYSKPSMIQSFPRHAI